MIWRIESQDFDGAPLFTAAQQIDPNPRHYVEQG
jgi:hypothetical protein